jgi:hypothetical protein
MASLRHLMIIVDNPLALIQQATRTKIEGKNMFGNRQTSKCIYYIEVNLCMCIQQVKVSSIYGQSINQN